MFCKRTFLPQFFDWWQVSATVEVTKGLVLASEITIVSVTIVNAIILYCFTWGWIERMQLALAHAVSMIYRIVLFFQEKISTYFHSV